MGNRKWTTRLRIADSQSIQLEVREFSQKFILMKIYKVSMSKERVHNKRVSNYKNGDDYIMATKTAIITGASSGIGQAAAKE